MEDKINTRSSFGFSFYTWVVSVAVGGILFSLSGLWTGGNEFAFDDFSMLPVVWMFSGIFSIPAFLALNLLVHIAERLHIIDSARLILVWLVSCLICSLTVGAFFGWWGEGSAFGRELMVFLVPYYASLALGIFTGGLIFKRNKKPAVAEDMIDAAELTIQE